MDGLNNFQRDMHVVGHLTTSFRFLLLGRSFLSKRQTLRQQLTSLEQAGESRCEDGLAQGQLAPARPQPAVTPATIKAATQATCADQTRSDHPDSRARAAPASHDADCAYNSAQDSGLWFCSPRALPLPGAEPDAKRCSSTRSIGSSGAETRGKGKGFALLRSPGRSFNGIFCALALCISTLHTLDVHH